VDEPDIDGTPGPPVPLSRGRAGGPAEAPANDENPHGRKATVVTPGQRPDLTENASTAPTTAPERRIRAARLTTCDTRPSCAEHPFWIGPPCLACRAAHHRRRARWLLSPPVDEPYPPFVRCGCLQAAGEWRRPRRILLFHQEGSVDSRRSTEGDCCRAGARGYRSPGPLAAACQLARSPASSVA